MELTVLKTVISGVNPVSIGNLVNFAKVFCFCSPPWLIVDFIGFIFNLDNLVKLFNDDNVFKLDNVDGFLEPVFLGFYPIPLAERIALIRETLILNASSQITDAKIRPGVHKVFYSRKKQVGRRCRRGGNQRAKISAMGSILNEECAYPAWPRPGILTVGLPSKILIFERLKSWQSGDLRDMKRLPSPLIRQKQCDECAFMCQTLAHHSSAMGKLAGVLSTDF